MDKLVLIDGNSLINRAFYATPLFTTKSGMPSNAVFGFVKLLLKIMSDKKPTYLAVAFDLHAPTFRHKMYDGYKAGRKPMPDDLAVQLPVLKEVLSLMRIKICEKEGYEADDVIGTLAKRFPVQTYIYTGDRDSYQLVDDTTSVCFTKRGVSDILELTPANFKKETGLDNPKQVIDYKSLMGDKSDNIPGVKGIGEKSALQLLETYGNLDGVYAHLSEITGANGKKLESGKEDAYLSYKLATIDTNSPIELTLADCVLRTPFPVSVREKFAELEFKSLVSLSIFEEKPETLAIESESKTKTVEERFPTTIQEVLFLYDSATSDRVACHFSERDFRLYFGGNIPEEIVLPIKENLLDVGFFYSDFAPVFKRIFTGEKTVVLYHSKEARHKLEEFDVEFTAPFADVSIMKCLGEGLGNTDSLDFCLNYHSISAQNYAFGTFRLAEIYFAGLNEAERKLYENTELPLSVVLYEMEKKGVCVDRKTLGEFSERYGTELKNLVENIYRLAGETFNINSPVQLGKILFEKLKIGEGSKSKGKRNYSTTAEVLEKYADEYEIVRLLLRYRQIQKLNSTYVEGFKPLITEKGRVHTTYNQSNTATGRLSSANPNLQNIPVRNDEGKELRKLFLASPGNVLVDADYSQIELRLLAHFSGCKELIEAYSEHKDIHAITASQVFGVPLEKVTSQMRREAKAVNFGIIYGISAFGLSKDLGISAKRAQAYIDKYFETYSDVKAYMERNVIRAKEDGYVTTLFGRRRVMNELKSSNYNVRSFGERAAMNMPLQGSSADLIKIAMLRVSERLKKENLVAKLVLQVHDELVIDCPIEEQEPVSKLLKEEMENAVTLKVPLIAEVGVGKSWYSAK